ncbi:MAG TPA: hypothetical protein VFU89_06790 [Rhabdochlamydiaceae bacterium]|nr:hypothetical protein [Rhabdochlamydiaceae bacterium]
MTQNITAQLSQITNYSSSDPTRPILATNPLNQPLFEVIDQVANEEFKSPRQEGTSDLEGRVTPPSSENIGSVAKVHAGDTSVLTYTLKPLRLEFRPQSLFPSTTFSEMSGSIFQSPNTSLKRSRDEDKPVSSDYPKPLMSLPFPDFSAMNQSSSNNKAPPPTPHKKARKETPSHFRSQYTALENGSFNMNGRAIQTTYLAEGSYSSVYTLEKTATQIIPGVNNGDLVIKAFNGKKAPFHDATLKQYLQNTINSYLAIQDLNTTQEKKLHVAEIYNIDTAVKDGYIIQRKVSGQVDILNPAHRQQIGQFFEASIRHSILMDLLPKNFGVDNGQVVLFDFVEDPDLDGEQTIENAIPIFNKQACDIWLKKLRSLPKEEALAIMNELTKNHYQKCIEILWSQLG